LRTGAGKGIWPKKDEITGGWRRPHNEEQTDFYSSPNIIRVIKTRKMRWVRHVARMGDRIGTCRVLLEKPETTSKSKA
jgi:hypothetical protein